MSIQIPYLCDIVEKNGSIFVCAQEYAVSYCAYLLEKAAYHIFDCDYEQPIAFKLHVQKFRLKPQIQPRIRANQRSHRTLVLTA